MNDLAIWDGAADDSVAAVFPLDLSGVAVGLRACIDASTHGTGTFAVAGVAFGYDRAVKANAKWSALMKGRTFHMTDLHNRWGEFEDIGDDEVGEIMHGAVAILRQFPSLIVCVSCDAELVRDQLPRVSQGGRGSDEMLKAFRSPYGAMCHLCMYGLGMRSLAPKPQISYVLEAGDEGQKGFSSYLNFVMGLNVGELVKRYSLAQFSVASKGGMAGIFHSADLVAWEWAKHVERVKNGRPMRGSLSALIGEATHYQHELGSTISGGARVFFRHYDENSMTRFARFMSDLTGAATPAEVDDAMDLWRETRPA